MSSPFSKRREQARLDRAYNHLPLKEADLLVTEQPSQTFQDTIKYGPDEDYWQPVDYSATVKDVAAPVSMLGGWYDLFLYWQLKDYQALRQAGKEPYLLIGPWYHGQPDSLGPSFREALYLGRCPGQRPAA